MDERRENAAEQGDLLQLTAKIAASYVGTHTVQATDLPQVLQSIHNALAQASQPAPPQSEPQQPAVPVKRSVTLDWVACLECGKKNKMLKRHLQSEHGLSPEEYRAKWSLPREYPMIAPNYAATRSELAKVSGLGRRRKTVAEIAPESAKPKKRGRKKAES